MVKYVAAYDNDGSGGTPISTHYDQTAAIRDEVMAVGTFVMLDEPGGDIYIAWSTNTDGPCTYGPYAEIHAHLVEDHGRTPDEADRQLRRAGQFGSSSPLAGAWDDHALICHGTNVDGLLPRRDLLAYARAVCRGTEAEDTDTADALLQPDNNTDPS